jgi:hypothetical protein
VDAHALTLEDGEDVGVRVAVTVAGPDADDRDRRAGRREERRVARRRTMVGHDEHLGREALGGDAMLDEVAHHRLGARLREAHVVGQTATRVGVALDEEYLVRIGLDDVSHGVRDALKPGDLFLIQRP